MNIIEATANAFELLLTGDGELWQIVFTSLSIALIALMFACIPALWFAYLLASKKFVGHQFVIALLHALLAVPTVAIGLILFLVLSRSGPLGFLEILFTPAAIALGQFIIALPILSVFAYNVLRPHITIIQQTAQTLGATKFFAMLTVFNEFKLGLIAALLTGFGRIISEIGCALLVGGNIAGSTRTLPTAIALDTARGQPTQGIALGIVLLVLALGTSFFIHAIYNKKVTKDE